MLNIIPNFWFNKNAEEAVNFYLSVFQDSKILSTVYYPKSENEGLADFQKDFAGKVLSIEFELSGTRFTAINADNTFTPNPSISMMVNFDPKYKEDARAELDSMWEKLSDCGKVLMPLDEYPFSKRYGWIEDKYGFSWQLILTDPEGDDRPFIIPSLLFVSASGMVAESATDFYLSVFKDSERGQLAHYEADMGNNKKGAVMFTDFRLGGNWFTAMDGSTKDHKFTFNEAISLLIPCKDQEEIDSYWNALTSNGGQESVCGWLKDTYGLSWQVAPENWEELLKKPGAFKKMMGMKKLVIADFQEN